MLYNKGMIFWRVFSYSFIRGPAVFFGVMVLGFNLHAENNVFKFANSGNSAPSFTTRSDGTRLVLGDTLSATATDYAIGVSSNAMWYTVPTASSAYSHKFYIGTTGIMNIQGDGKVAIGTTAAPSGTLDIISSSTPTLYLGKALYFGNANHGVIKQYRNANDVGFYTTNGGGTSDLYLSAAYNTAPNTQFILRNGGNVGIGTDSPTEVLQVSGNISANALMIRGVSQWRLIDSDTFVNTSDGWASNVGTPYQQLSMYGTTLQGQWMLGGYNKFGQSAYASKSFTVPATYTEIRIKFKLYLIDTWDGWDTGTYAEGECMKIYLATSADSSKLIWYEKRFSGDRQTGDAGGYHSLDKVYANNNAYGNTSNNSNGAWYNYNDMLTDIDIILPYSVVNANLSSGKMPLYLTSTLNQPETDESWGISNVEIYAR